MLLGGGISITSGMIFKTPFSSFRSLVNSPHRVSGGGFIELLEIRSSKDALFEGSMVPAYPSGSISR
jgi:hypothetical protein